MPEDELTFLDSYKYFPQKLSSLPKRFELPEVKGYFPHVFNKAENWNLIVRHPPPLQDYISKQDSVKVKEEKTQWWSQVKNLEPLFNFNQDAVVYCKKDVMILMAAAVKFLKQTFQFGKQMIERFGPSSSWRKGLHQPYFHPFSRASPTLGAYS